VNAYALEQILNVVLHREYADVELSRDRFVFMPPRDKAQDLFFTFRELTKSMHRFLPLGLQSLAASQNHPMMASPSMTS
jgi:hypothetical protein